MQDNGGCSSSGFSFAGQLQLNFNPNIEEASLVPKPGELRGATARYRCPKCGSTIIVNKNERMPPCGVCKKRGAVWQCKARLT